MATKDPWKQSKAAESAAVKAGRAWERARKRERAATAKAKTAFAAQSAAFERADQTLTDSTLREARKARLRAKRANAFMERAAKDTDTAWKQKEKAERRETVVQRRDNTRRNSKLVGTPKRGKRLIR